MAKIYAFELASSHTQVLEIKHPNLCDFGSRAWHGMEMFLQLFPLPPGSEVDCYPSTHEIPLGNFKGSWASSASHPLCQETQRALKAEPVNGEMRRLSKEHDRLLIPSVGVKASFAECGS